MMKVYGTSAVIVKGAGRVELECTIYRDGDSTACTVLAHPRGGVVDVPTFACDFVEAQAFRNGKPVSPVVRFSPATIAATPSPSCEPTGMGSRSERI